MSNEYNQCDGALWYVDMNETECNVESTIYRYKDRDFEPDDLGYKYHVLTYKEDKSEAEVMTAYIGDVAFFINNHAKAGYHGMIVKSKAIPLKDIRKMFKKILSNWEFPTKMIQAAVSQV